jgi:hypothetical protein
LSALTGRTRLRVTGSVDGFEIKMNRPPDEIRRFPAV